jgi:hypothetical protein
MRHALTTLLFIALAVPACARVHNRSTTISIDTDDWSEVANCSQIRVTIDGRQAVRAEENVSIGAVKTLHVAAGNRGGVYVIGSTDGAYSVKLCKAAALAGDLANIRARFSGSELSVVGDSGSDGDDDDDDHDDARDVMGFYLIRAPRGSSLDLEAQNGSISVHGVEGTIRANAVNGPIAVKHSTGTIDVTTENGPITLAGGGGTVKLHAQNGPISVKLDGTTWNGSLDAKTENGPVSLKLPRGYRSGVVVESNGHGPMRCRAEACRGAKRTWDDDDDANHRIEFGEGAKVVRLATVNGPVSVKERDPD